ncbi:MAG: hypothetical protein WA799_08735 [Nitrosotalea sp.]
MVEWEDRIRDLSKMFAFQIMTHTITIEERLKDIICMSIDKKRSNVIKFSNYFDNISLDKKIPLAKLILECNYPEILQKYPNIFSTIGQIKKWRNDLAHLNRYFEINHMSNNETYLVLHNRSVSKQKKLTEKKMYSIMQMAEKCSLDMLKITNLVAEENRY